MDILQELWDNSESLLNTFNLIPAIDPQMRKFYEEVREFSQVVDHIEILEAAEIPFDPNFYDNAAKEGADVIVMILQVCNTLGISYEDLERFIRETMIKNSAKTLETHEVINGIIKRRT